MIAPLMRSPIARNLADLEARFDVEGGWEVPTSFADADVEERFLRESVGVADVTSRGKVDLRGEVDAALPVVGAATTARLARGWAMVFTEPGGAGEVLERAAAAVGGDAMVTDVTHLYAGFAFAGPRVPDVLARLTSWDPATLPPGAAAGAPIAGARAVILRREGTPSLVEVYVGSESARSVWEAIADAVDRVGGGPVGLLALRAEGWR